MSTGMSSNEVDSDEVLENFRQEWRQELLDIRSSRRNSEQEGQFASLPSIPGCQHGTDSRKACLSDQQTDTEAKASELFNKGIELEQNGQLYQAIQFYKKAILLVPDIEVRVHRKYIREMPEVCQKIVDDCITCKSSFTSGFVGGNFLHIDYSGNSKKFSEGYETTKDPAVNHSDNNVQELVNKFQRILGENSSICQQGYPQQETHISSLPAEMLMHILMWVVGEDLDLRSLEQLSEVCKGFYILCRNPEIWKRVCQRIWGIKKGTLTTYKSWRDMGVWRPRPRFSGCYISRTTYFRPGESSFQDENYKPWHFVQYFRYFRFFASGVVLMLTSSEEPHTAVSHLRTPEVKNQQVLEGNFLIQGNSLSVLFRRVARSRPYRKVKGTLLGLGTTDVAETHFKMELEIKTVRGKPHWQLAWRKYQITSVFFDSHKTTSDVDIQDTNSFPPLFFSRVKSYLCESYLPLP